jgi:hypothetical protein
VSRLVDLYPPAWRERYLAELEDLLADRPPTVRDRLDILRGAIDAWIHPQVGAGEPRQENGALGSRVFAGAAAVVGGGLWIAGALTINATQLNPGFDYKEPTAGVLLLVAGMLVTALAATAMAGSVVVGSRSVGPAAIGMLLGAMLTAMPWPMLIIGFYGYILATLVFGTVLARSAGRAVGGVLAVAALILSAFNVQDERALIAIPFGLAWIAVGSIALRRAPAAPAATAA